MEVFCASKQRENKTFERQSAGMGNYAYYEIARVFFLNNPGIRENWEYVKRGIPHKRCHDNVNHPITYAVKNFELCL